MYVRGSTKLGATISIPGGGSRFLRSTSCRRSRCARKRTAFSTASSRAAATDNGLCGRFSLPRPRAVNTHSGTKSQVLRASSMAESARRCCTGSTGMSSGGTCIGRIVKVFLSPAWTMARPALCQWQPSLSLAVTRLTVGTGVASAPEAQSVSQLFHGPAPRSPLHRLSEALCVLCCCCWLFMGGRFRGLGFWFMIFRLSATKQRSSS